MNRKSLDDFGELQRAVIEAVWESGEATVRQVWKRLCREKELAYTTVLTAMQRLERDGWLKHRVEGKTHVYLPTRTRAQAGTGRCGNSCSGCSMETPWCCSASLLRRTN